jgi:hypothetical protein
LVGRYVFVGLGYNGLAQRPWVGSKLPCDDKDMALFRASTRISLGDGRKSLFWRDNWSGKGRFCDMASDLYKIASRKKRLVSKELDNNNSITAVFRLNSMKQF